MGTPTDCVYLGVNALMRPRPTLLCPELTPGRIWGMMLFIPYGSRRDGRPSFRFSGACRLVDGHKHYDTAAAVTCSILRACVKSRCAPGVFLILTFRIYPGSNQRYSRDALRYTTSGRSVIPQQDPRGNTLYWIGPPGGNVMPVRGPILLR